MCAFLCVCVKKKKGLFSSRIHDFFDFFLKSRTYN